MKIVLVFLSQIVDNRMLNVLLSSVVISLAHTKAFWYESIRKEVSLFLGAQRVVASAQRGSLFLVLSVSEQPSSFVPSGTQSVPLAPWEN